MSYIGRDHQLSEIKKIDNIAGSFNGVAVTFSLTSGGTPISPANAAQCIIALNGYLKEPFVDYSISGSYISFTTPPSGGTVFSGLALGRSFNVGASVVSGPASGITFTPTGGISSVNVQAALAELDSEKLSSTGTIDNAVNSTTQAFGDATTKIATTAFVDRLRDVPANAQAGVYTLALTDRGKSVDTQNNVTIPANSVVAFPIGSVVNITNLGSASITISINTDSLRQAGTTNTGTRTLAGYGMATIRKVDTNSWFISGAGLS